MHAANPLPLLVFLWTALTFGQLAVADITEALPSPAELELLPGFVAERLYVTPREQGSWVSMAFDLKGRIVVSHEGGGLYRITPSPLGEPHRPTTVERLNAMVGAAHGLLFAFDSLYAVAGGLQRLRDTNGDDEFDSVETLMPVGGRGEHGAHAVVLGPQGKWLYLIAGNATPLPAGLTANHVAMAADSKSFRSPSPQGWVMRTDSTGRKRELYCVGLRNAYGMALSPAGELFTFDSDNEGFMNLPWYRPTNVYHLVSGADFGWRQGPETLQSYHLDNVAPVLEVGPGSPTGMVFGSAARFPAKYQRALFVCDWSYGRIHAIHLRPHGASYRAEHECFVSGRPLAVADIRIGPDGAMYFLTGGRGTQSTLYRVAWDASHSKPSTVLTTDDAEARQLRHRMENFHGRQDPAAVKAAWPLLESDDSALRYAARVAIEHQPVKQWTARAMAEPNMIARLAAVTALARQGDASLQSTILDKLKAIDWSDLSRQQQLSLMHAYDLTFQRMGAPDGSQRMDVLRQLDPNYPSGDVDVDRELIRLLVDLQAEDLAQRTIRVLRRTPTAMRQIHFLLQLSRRNVQWTEEQKEQLRQCLDLEAIRDTGQRPYKDVAEMITNLLGELGASEPVSALPRPTVRQWKLPELLPLAETGALRSADLGKGRALFRQAQCHRCHRVGSTGGVLGPNLTGLAGRFRPIEVLESIVEPNKVISDQYRTTVFLKTDGETFTGQIVNFGRGNIQVRLDPTRPFPRVSFPESEIKKMRQSDVSLMPQGLLDQLTKSQIADLLAYLLQAR